MLELKSANKSYYITIGLLCGGCLDVIDREAPGKKRKCANCIKKNK